MEQDSRDLLTVEQAAQYLQISQSSIRSYIRQGMLKAFQNRGKAKGSHPPDRTLGPFGTRARVGIGQHARQRWSGRERRHGC